MSQRRSKLTGVASMDGAKGTREENRSPCRLVLALIVALASTAYAQSNDAAGARARRQVIVSVPDRKLAVLENGVVLLTFAVAVGAAVSPSPTGEFAIVNRLTEPTYYHAGVVIPAGPGNPLGPRWVGLNKQGYGIHGTNAPGSIGKAASHGCIRLRNRDIVQLFAMVSMGDTVEIRGERDEQTAQIFGGELSAPVSVAQAQTAAAVGGGQ
jgi:lipoprotein-anchoring transpeptidase ErfK/SrfK